MTKAEITEFATELAELAESQVDSGLRSALDAAVWDIEDGRFVDASYILTDVKAYLRWVSRVLPWRDAALAGVSVALVKVQGLIDSSRGV